MVCYSWRFYYQCYLTLPGFTAKRKMTVKQAQPETERLNLTKKAVEALPVPAVIIAHVVAFHD